DRLQGILDAQRRILDSLAGAERGSIAFKFGVRWATRHQNLEVGAQLLEESLMNDPTNEAAFSFLRDLYGVKEGNWDKVLQLAERLAAANASSPFMIAQAGTVAWRQLGNLIRAREWFEKLAEIAPGHPALEAFEAQIGEKIGGGAGGGASPAE